MNTREAFEAWARSAWGNQAYRHISATSGEWEAWQAGAAWAARECVKECEAQANQRYTGGDACAGIADAIRTQFPESFTKE